MNARRANTFEPGLDGAIQTQMSFAANVGASDFPKFGNVGFGTAHGVPLPGSRDGLKHSPGLGPLPRHAEKSN